MMGLLLDEIVNYQTHAFFSEGHLYLRGPSSPEGPLVEDSRRLDAQVLVGSRVSSSRSPAHSLPLPFLEKITFTNLQSQLFWDHLGFCSACAGLQYIQVK